MKEQNSVPEEHKEKLELFWELYDEYIEMDDPPSNFINDLSGLLAQLEKQSKSEQLFRPEKGWNEIVGWQVLKGVPYVTSGNCGIKRHFFQGEIIVTNYHWDRDNFLHRLPDGERMSGYLLKPGCFLGSKEEHPEMSKTQWDELIRRYPIVDERGLYLPIYEFATLRRLFEKKFAQIMHAKLNIIAEHERHSKMRR